MKHVELIRGRDYFGRGVKACRSEPLLVDEDKAEELVESGFFRYLDMGMPAGVAVPGAGTGFLGMGTLEAGVSSAGEVQAGAGMPAVQVGFLREAASDVAEPQAPAVSLPCKKSGIERMKTAELIACAEEYGIDISGCRTNAERASIILAVLQQEDAVVTDSAEGGRNQEKNEDLQKYGILPEEDGASPGEGAEPDFGEGAV